MHKYITLRATLVPDDRQTKVCAKECKGSWSINKRQYDAARARLGIKHWPDALVQLVDTDHQVVVFRSDTDPWKVL